MKVCALFENETSKLSIAGFDSNNNPSTTFGWYRWWKQKIDIIAPRADREQAYRYLALTTTISNTTQLLNAVKASRLGTDSEEFKLLTRRSRACAVAMNGRVATRQLTMIGNNTSGHIVVTPDNYDLYLAKLNDLMAPLERLSNWRVANAPSTYMLWGSPDLVYAAKHHKHSYILNPYDALYSSEPTKDIMGCRLVSRPPDFTDENIKTFFTTLKNWGMVTQLKEELAKCRVQMSYRFPFRP